MMGFDILEGYYYLFFFSGAIQWKVMVVCDVGLEGLLLLEGLIGGRNRRNISR